MLGLGTVHLNSILVDCNLVVEGGGDAVEAEAWVDRGAEAGGRWVVVDGCNDGNPDGVPDGTPDACLTQFHWICSMGRRLDPTLDLPMCSIPIGGSVGAEGL